MTPEEFLVSISEAERAERVKRSLPPHHVLDMAEFPFAFAPKTFQRFAAAAAKWAAQMPDDFGAHSINAFARVLLGDYRGADEALKRYAALRPTDAFGGLRFATLPEGEPMELPTVRGQWPSTPSFFISCDTAYLAAYGVPLLRSIADHARGAAVHVHVIGEHPELAGLDLSLTLTSEDATPLFSRGLQPRIYYHAVRLVRFAQALKAGGHPLVMSDADALVTADPRPLLTLPGDVGLRVRAGRIEPWHHFSACIVRGTPAGLPFFETAAEIVLRMLNNPFWGLDQYALFAAYLRTRPRLDLFGPDIAGIESDTPGLFWFTAGTGKTGLEDDQSLYAALYRKYRQGAASRTGV